jgi:hypothetical protein
MGKIKIELSVKVKVSYSEKAKLLLINAGWSFDLDKIPIIHDDGTTTFYMYSYMSSGI